MIGRADVADLGIPRHASLQAERGSGTDPQQPGGRRERQDDAQDHRHNQDARCRHDGPGTAPEDSAGRQAEDGRHGRDCRRAEHHPKADPAGQRQLRPDRRPPAIGIELVGDDRQRDGGADEAGREGDRADHDGLGYQDPAAPRACGDGRADHAAPVLGGHEQGAERDEGNQAKESAEERDVQRVHDGLERRDVTRASHRKGSAGRMHRPGRRPCRPALDAVAVRRDLATTRTLRLRANGRGHPIAARFRESDVVKCRGRLGTDRVAAVPGAEGLLERRRGRKQPGLRGSRQAREHGRADRGPVPAIGRLVAGDGVTRPGQPQPGRGHSAARDVVGEVVLHTDAVVPGQHDGRVGSSRLRAGLDHEAGLGPRHSRWRRGEAWREVLPRGGTAQRANPRGEAAVAGKCLVHEVEAVGHCIACRAGRDDLTFGLTDPVCARDGVIRGRRPG